MEWRGPVGGVHCIKKNDREIAICISSLDEVYQFVFLLLKSTSVSQLLRQERNRNKGNEEAFFFDQLVIAVTEGEEIEPKTVEHAGAKPSSLTTCFRQADIKPRIRTCFDH